MKFKKLRKYMVSLVEFNAASLLAIYEVKSIIELMCIKFLSSKINRILMA